MAITRVKQIERCPHCNNKVNKIGYGQFYCKFCDRWYKGDKEIEFSKNGEFFFVKNSPRKGFKNENDNLPRV